MMIYYRYKKHVRMILLLLVCLSPGTDPATSISTCRKWEPDQIPLSLPPTDFSPRPDLSARTASRRSSGRKQGRCAAHPLVKPPFAPSAPRAAAVPDVRRRATSSAGSLGRCRELRSRHGGVAPGSPLPHAVISFLPAGSSALASFVAVPVNENGR
jgi:hypothetical protein